MLSTPPAPPLQPQNNTSSGSGGAMHGQQGIGGSSTATSVSHLNQSGGNNDPGSASGTPNSIHSNTAAATSLPLNATSQQQAPSAGDGSKQYIGEGLVPDVMPPPLEHLEPSFERLGLTMEDAGRFFSAYRSHCEVGLLRHWNACLVQRRLFSGHSGVREEHDVLGRGALLASVLAAG